MFTMICQSFSLLLSLESSVTLIFLHDLTVWKELIPFGNFSKQKTVKTMIFFLSCKISGITPQNLFSLF